MKWTPKCKLTNHRDSKQSGHQSFGEDIFWSIIYKVRKGPFTRDNFDELNREHFFVGVCDSIV